MYNYITAAVPRSRNPKIANFRDDLRNKNISLRHDYGYALNIGLTSLS